MLKQNITEYQIVREAIESTRHRLTTLMSFAIGGAGVFYFAINSLEKSNLNGLSTSLICMFSATLISAFYYLALYKFNSINRYTGYLKLINQEIRIWNDNNGAEVDEKNIPEHFITWELCISKLANTTKRSSFNENYWTKVLKYKGVTIEILKSKFIDFNLLNPKVDKDSLTNGIKLLLKGISKNDKSVSWKYPLYSSYIYIVLIIFFVALLFISLFKYFILTSNTLNYKTILQPEIIIILFLTLIISVVISRSFTELYRLMKGSKTVSAYCWKFLPYRIQILNQYGVIPQYLKTEE